MPHTASRYQQDLGFDDGRIIYGPKFFQDFGANAGVVTQNAVGDISMNWSASQSAKIDINLASHYLLRTGFDEDLQLSGGGTGIVGSAGPQGRPPFTAAVNAAVRTAKKLKGIKPLSLAVIYSITGAALTAHTCRVDKTIFSNNVANAITSVLASGANGLATATQANPYVTEIPLTSNYIVDDLSELWFEIVATTQVAGAYRLYGVRLKVEYNFN